MPKILVVEDEKNLQKLLKANLAARGYQVLVAPDGEKGLQLAQLEHPDLVLLDLVLPGISGWEVLMTLKVDQKLREIPVVIMTASTHRAEEVQAQRWGAISCLVKPFGADELMRQVKLAIGR